MKELAKNGHPEGCGCIVCTETRAAVKSLESRALLGSVSVVGVTEYDIDTARAENLLAMEFRDLTVKLAALELRFFSADIALHVEIQYAEVQKAVEVMSSWLRDLDRRKTSADRRAALEQSAGGRRTKPWKIQTLLPARTCQCTKPEIDAKGVCQKCLYSAVPLAGAFVAPKVEEGHR